MFHFATQRVEEVEVTDPYSRCLSADGARSMFVNLDRDSSLIPAGWQAHAPPQIAGAAPPTKPCCSLQSVVAFALVSDVLSV